jgi:hypothetical protein
MLILNKSRKVLLVSLPQSSIGLDTVAFTVRYAAWPPEPFGKGFDVWRNLMTSKFMLE